MKRCEKCTRGRAAFDKSRGKFRRKAQGRGCAQCGPVLCGMARTVVPVCRGAGCGQALDRPLQATAGAGCRRLDVFCPVPRRLCTASVHVAVDKLWNIRCSPATARPAGNRAFIDQALGGGLWTTALPAGWIVHSRSGRGCGQAACSWLQAAPCKACRELDESWAVAARAALAGLSTVAGDQPVDKLGMDRQAAPAAGCAAIWRFFVQRPAQRLYTIGVHQAVDNLGAVPCRPRLAWPAGNRAENDQPRRRRYRLSRLKTSRPSQMQANASSCAPCSGSPNSSTACSSTRVGARYCRKPRVA